METVLYSAITALPCNLLILFLSGLATGYIALIKRLNRRTAKEGA